MDKPAQRVSDARVSDCAKNIDLGGRPPSEIDDLILDLRDARATIAAQAEQIAGLEAENARLTALLHSMSAAIDSARTQGKDADACYLDMVADRDSWREQEGQITKMAVAHLDRAESAEAQLKAAREAATAFIKAWDENYKYVRSCEQIAAIHGAAYGGRSLMPEIDALRALAAKENADGL